MKQLIGILLGHLEDSGKSDSNPEDVLHLLPLFSRFIDEQLIQKGYQRARRRRGERITRRSGRKLTVLRLICMELYKALHGNISYNQVLERAWNIWTRKGVLETSRPAKSSYSEARKRLPLEVYECLFEKVRAQIRSQEGKESDWNGRRIVTIDGVDVPVPPRMRSNDTFQEAENQYSNAYWSQYRMVWAVDVLCGDLLGGRQLEEEEHEETVAPYLAGERIRQGDVLLGDARYATTAVMKQVIRQGGCFLVGKHTSIRIDKRTEGKHEEGDLVLELPITDYMSDKYQDLSLEGPLKVRAVWLDGDPDQEGRWFLTNLEHGEVSREEIKKLVQLRWGHELVNRQIKDGQGIREIRSTTEGRIRKEVLAHLVTYNMICWMLGQLLEVIDEDGSGADERTDRIWRSEFETPRRDYGFEKIRRGLARANRALIEESGGYRQIIAQLIEEIRQSRIPVRDRRAEPRRVRPNKTNYTEFHGDREEWRDRNVR